MDTFGGAPTAGEGVTPDPNVILIGKRMGSLKEKGFGIIFQKGALVVRGTRTCEEQRLALPKDVTRTGLYGGDAPQPDTDGGPTYVRTAAFGLRPTSSVC